MIVALAVKEDRGTFLVYRGIAVKSDRHRVFVLVIVDQVLSLDMSWALHPLVIGAVFARPVGVAGDLAVLHRGPGIGSDPEGMQDGERTDRCSLVSLMAVVAHTVLSIAAVCGKLAGPAAVGAFLPEGKVVVDDQYDLAGLSGRSGLL